MDYRTGWRKTWLKDSITTKRKEFFSYTGKKNIN
jgi:hypothetical protein